MTKRYNNDTILVFGDIHAPYQHKNTLEFLGDIASTYQPDRIVNLGDLGDIYSVSNYPTDIDHPDSWSNEIKGLRKFVKKLSELFPDQEVLTSNHDDRVYRKSIKSGIPREALIKYEKLIGAPSTWKWHDRLTLTVDSTRERITFAHTMTGGVFACAKSLGMTTVIGHSHTKFGVQAFSPTKGKIIYGVDAGCLISDKGSPFSYNKGDRGRPIRGCCIIKEGVPFTIPMG